MTKYTIIHVPYDPEKWQKTISPVAQPLDYDRERDEPILNKVWRQMAALRAAGLLKPTPPLPPGGIRLRGRGCLKQAESNAAEASTDEE